MLQPSQQDAHTHLHIHVQASWPHAHFLTHLAPSSPQLASFFSHNALPLTTPLHPAPSPSRGPRKLWLRGNNWKQLLKIPDWWSLKPPHPLKLYPRHNQVLLAWSDAWSQYAALSESLLFFATEREVGGPKFTAGHATEHEVGFDECWPLPAQSYQWRMTSAAHTHSLNQHRNSSEAPIHSALRKKNAVILLQMEHVHKRSY